MNNYKKKVTFKDIFKVNVKYLEYLLDKSYLSHQYFENIRLSGDQIENELRRLLTSLLPSRYKVTHGYIATVSRKDIEPIVSSQIDIIIVDTLVPHSIFIFEDKGMELVPIESVIGIFEVKRTIDPTTLDDALGYLHKIQKELNLWKTDCNTYFPAGVQGLGVLYSNPLVGILGLSNKQYSDIDEYKKNYGEIINKRINNHTMPDLDICTSLGNLIIATHQENNPQNLWAYTLRDKNKKYPYVFKIRDKDGLSQAYFLSISLGFILFYFSNITGRMANLENYFFNELI